MPWFDHVGLSWGQEGMYIYVIILICKNIYDPMCVISQIDIVALNAIVICSSNENMIILYIVPLP